jgi:CRP-like cAMP-binding protein
MSATSGFDPPATLGTKLQQYLRLSQAEKDALAGLSFRVQRIEPGGYTVRDGDKPTTSQMVLAGILATSKSLTDGRRQIASMHIKGDWPDLLSLHLGRMDSDIQALTVAWVAFIDHSDIRRLCRVQPRIGDLFWKFTLIDAAVFRHWVVNVGQRAAEPRVAHLLCEYVTRAEYAALAEANRCELPITQSDLADATGMSTVHVNRTLQSLRARKLISWDQGILTVHDRKGLEALADFWPDYLHLPSPEESK